MAKLVTVGTKTTTGGAVLDGHDQLKIDGQPVASTNNSLASCSSGRKTCKGVGKIAPTDGGNLVMMPDGNCAVLSRYKVLCNCPDNFILEPSHRIFVDKGKVKVVYDKGTSVDISGSIEWHMESGG